MRVVFCALLPRMPQVAISIGAHPAITHEKCQYNAPESLCQ